MLDRSLNEAEQDVLDVCFDLGGGSRAILINTFPEIDPVDLNKLLIRLADLGLLRQTRSLIGYHDDVFEDDIWELTPRGRASVSPDDVD